MNRPRQFHRLLFADACAHGPPGELPTPLALVLHDADTGERVLIGAADCQAAWSDAVDADTLVVCLDAENVGKALTCWGLPRPRHLVDLGVEARMHLNGLTPSSIADTVLALTRFGVARAPLIHDVMLERKLHGHALDDDDYRRVVALIHTRLDCTLDLWAAMGDIDLAHALLRGRYLKTVATTGLRGLPVDASTLAALDTHHVELLHAAVATAPSAPDGIGFYVHTADGVKFRASALRHIAQHDPDWPADEDGQVSLANKALDAVEAWHPELRGLAVAHRRVDGLMYRTLPVGSDSRHRYAQRPFASTTGRNQPLGREALPMQAKWRRNMVVAPPGRSLIVVDYSSEELAIAAALSGDELMQQVYAAEDSYIRLGQLVGAIPAGATKESHPRDRGIFKVVSLAVQYGGGPGMVAKATGLSLQDASELLARHHRMFQRFWAWSEAAVNEALLTSKLQTVFGWQRQVEAGTSVRTLRNFPAQANGGEILRLAAIGIAEAGLDLCATIHDACVVEAADNDVDAVAAAVKHHMVNAGKVVLGGFELKVDTQVVRTGRRWRQSAAGEDIWRWVVQQLHFVGVDVPDP